MANENNKVTGLRKGRSIRQLERHLSSNSSSKEDNDKNEFSDLVKEKVPTAHPGISVKLKLGDTLANEDSSKSNAEVSEVHSNEQDFEG